MQATKSAPRDTAKDTAHILVVDDERSICEMLEITSSETGEAITALRSLLNRMMEHQSKKTARLRALHSW